jgi:hypothetical protein
MVLRHIGEHADFGPLVDLYVYPPPLEQRAQPGIDASGSAGSAIQASLPRRRDVLASVDVFESRIRGARRFGHIRYLEEHVDLGPLVDLYVFVWPMEQRAGLGDSLPGPQMEAGREFVPFQLLSDLLGSRQMM